MVYHSKYNALDLPRCNLLSFLFPPGQHVSTEPLWIDADEPSRSLSPRQMLTAVKRFATGLEGLGVGENQTVVVFSPNSIFVPMIFLATVGSKRRFSGANPTYSAEELRYQLDLVDAAVVFVHPSLVQTGLAACAKAGVPKHRIFLLAATPCTTSMSGVRDWREMRGSEAAAQQWMWDGLDGDEDAARRQVAVLNFSSGTTGMPKGVAISHYNLVSNTLQIITAMFDGQPPTDIKAKQHRWLTFLPMYHAFSQFWTILLACRLNYPVYIMEKFALDQWLGHIQRYRISSLQVVPPVLLLLDKRAEVGRYDLSSLGHVFCGAAPLALELKRRLSSRFGLSITQGWGMTETSAVGIMVPDTMVGRDDEILGNSIGVLLPNTMAKLCDDEGHELASNSAEPGELWVKGPQVMLEYLGNEPATRATVVDGWCRTGDVAVVRGHQWYIVDRKKELIKVNGLQVSPAEMEGLLIQSHDVADVAVVGITLESRELPRAYVVLKPSSSASARADDQQLHQKEHYRRRIHQFVADRCVAKHKRLAGGIVFVDEIPKLPSGKIVRKEVKQWAKRDAARMESESKSKL